MSWNRCLKGSTQIVQAVPKELRYLIRLRRQFLFLNCTGNRDSNFNSFKNIRNRFTACRNRYHGIIAFSSAAGIMQGYIRSRDGHVLVNNTSALFYEGSRIVAIATFIAGQTLICFRAEN